MRWRRSYKVLLGALVFIAAIGCSATSSDTDIRDWIAEPTPEIWNLHSEWVLLLMDDQNRLIRSLTVRFTDELVDTCVSGEWRRVEIMTERPSRAATFVGEPAYELVGSALEIDLSSNLCDAAYPMRGRLLPTGVVGQHGPEHNFGGEIVGHFVGAPVH